MQNNSASVNVDISCLGCGDMLRENWTARNLRPLIGQFTLFVFYYTEFMANKICMYVNNTMQKCS